MSAETIHWNPDVKLILADVDQTLADDFKPAESEMIDELDGVLQERKALFYVTGSPLLRFNPRIGDRLTPELRQQMIVGHCSGAEVWGFDVDGTVLPEPFYSLYDERVNDEQKRMWREIVDGLVAEFQLEKYPPQPLEAFHAQVGDNPFAIIYEDRGPQITLEVINGHELTESQRAQVRAKLPHLEEVIDLREPMRAWVQERLDQHQVPITARLAGVFALDLAIEGVSKTDCVRRVLSNPKILQHIGLGDVDLTDPTKLEVWGDRFDQGRGTDWLISVALDPRVRSIDFRREDPAHFPEGFNIQIWNGEHELQDGALEYLQSRHQ